MAIVTDFRCGVVIPVGPNREANLRDTLESLEAQTYPVEAVGMILDGPDAVGGQQHDPRAPDVLLWAIAIRHHRLKAATVGGIHFDDDPFAHSEDSHIRRAEGIRCGTLVSDFIH